MTDTMAENIQKYSESPIFTEQTVPAALLRNHATKRGTWGQIVVLDGALLYTRMDHEVQLIQAGETGTIFPEELHAVQPKGRVKFKVEFYRATGTGD